MIDWDNLISHLFNITQSKEDAPPYALTMKLSEEVGEFNEVMLHELGFLRHKDKDWKDTPIEEAADIINVLIGTLAVHYPNKTPEELSAELKIAMIKKGNKYARILGATDLPTG